MLDNNLIDQNNFNINFAIINSIADQLGGFRKKLKIDRWA